jgi:hypothetical protein
MLALDQILDLAKQRPVQPVGAGMIEG